MRLSQRPKLRPTSKTRRVKVERKRKADDARLPVPPPGQRDAPTDDDGNADGASASAGIFPEAESKDDLAETPEGDPPKGALLPHVPGISPLTTALRNLGPNAVDGVPATVHEPSTRCSVPACCSPGGHRGPHEDADGVSSHGTPIKATLMEIRYQQALTVQKSFCQKILLREKPLHNLAHAQPENLPAANPSKELVYALEIDILPSDTQVPCQER